MSLGFAKREDSFIYAKDMPLGEFARTLGEGPLRMVPSLADGEWVRTTTVEGNHTVVERKKSTIEDRGPSESTVVRVCVNLELKRMPYLELGYPIGSVHDSLLHLGARQVKVDSARPGQVWSQYYVLPEGTCLELRVEDRTPSRGKPCSPGIREITLGEPGRGYVTPEVWGAQSKSTLKKLSLNRYRQVLD
jgi:hypothetical protein